MIADVADTALLSDHRIARDLGERADDGVHADLHVRIHRDRFGLLDRHALDHQFADLALAQDAIGLGEFDTIVDPEKFVGVRNLQRGHAHAGANENRNHIGEIVFARRIIGAQLMDMLPQRCGFKAKNPRVDLAHRELLGRAGFVLDDLENTAIGSANDAPVAGGILHLGRDHGGRGAG